MSGPTSWRWLLAPMSALLLTGCDFLMTEPAPASRDVAVSFQIGENLRGGTAAAFSRVRRVELSFIRADQAQRDTVIAVAPSDGRIVARVTLQADELILGLGVGAELGYGATDLFQGFAVVPVVPGEPTTAAIPIDPIAAGVIADQPVVPLVGLGVTAQLTSTVQFASGDTITGAAGLWSLVDSGVVSVSPAGAVISQGFGTARLEVRLNQLADTAVVQVTRLTAGSPPFR